MTDDDPKTSNEALAALFEHAAELSREPINFDTDVSTETTES
ncbi:hypothetical protein [Xanthobacter autotrophicus]|nr:hypothetical protein [Xanthobacter autotrophicus]